MKTCWILLGLALMASTAAAQVSGDLPTSSSGGPDAPPEFDPEPGASGVWVSETTLDTGVVRAAWRVTHVVPENKVALYADARAGEGADGAMKAFRAAVHLDWRAWKDGTVEIPAPDKSEGQKLDLTLRWTSWLVMEGEFVKREWKAENGEFGWRETARYRTVWRKVVPEIRSVKEENKGTAEGWRGIEITIGGRNLPPGGGEVFLTNGIGDFPYAVRAPRAKLEQVNVGKSDAGSQIFVAVRVPADLPAGSYGGFVAGRAVPRLFTILPSDDRALLQFEDLQGNPISSAPLGAIVRLRLIAPALSKGSARTVRVEAQTLSGEVLTEPADTGVRVAWYFPPLLPDGEGTFVTEPLRLVEHPKDPARDSLPGGTLRCVRTGLLMAQYHRPGTSWNEAAASAALALSDDMPGSLEVRVTDLESGAPVEGATVTVLESATDQVVSSASQGASHVVAFTDLLTPGVSYRVVARCPARGTAERAVAGVAGKKQTLQIDVPFQPGEVGGVVVHGLTGKPIRGVKVSLGILHPETPRAALESLTTAEDGTFLFQGAEGRYRLLAESADTIPTTRDVQVAPRGSVTVRLELYPNPLGNSPLLYEGRPRTEQKRVPVTEEGVFLQSLLDHPELGRDLPDVVDTAGRLMLGPSSGLKGTDLEKWEGEKTDLDAIETFLVETVALREAKSKAWKAASERPASGDDALRGEAIAALEEKAAALREAIRTKAETWVESQKDRARVEREGSDGDKETARYVSDMLRQELDVALEQQAKNLRMLHGLKQSGSLYGLDRVEPADVEEVKQLLERLRKKKGGGR